jgi:hypothetical protein
MSEMVDRIANAIWQDDLRNGRWRPEPAADEGTLMDSYRSSARAAIKAMREPLDGIAEAMNRHASNGMVDWRDLHEAMIDEMLK